MLIKRIHILTGPDGEKGVLKIKRLENAYCEIDLTIHSPILPEYLIALTADEYSELLTEKRPRITKKILDTEPLNVTVANSDGKILLCNYPSERSKLLIENETKVEEREETEVKIEEESKETVGDETPIEEEKDEFGIIDLAPPRESYDEDFVKEFEEKYPTSAHNEELEKAAPHSKWILSEDGVISVGLLYNSEGATHICYAQKGEAPDYPAERLDDYWVTYNQVRSEEYR